MLTAEGHAPPPVLPRTGDACAMVIFGASGDLTKRKLVPALYNLTKDKLLSKEFALVGFSRQALADDQFRQKISEEIADSAATRLEPDVWHWLARRIHYVSGTFDDSEAYQQLKTLLTPQTGYERLLYDCMMVDATLFQRSDVEETGWQIVAPLLDVRGALPARNSPNYESASWAPQEADELLRRDGRSWGQSE